MNEYGTLVRFERPNYSPSTLSFGLSMHAPTPDLFEEIDSPPAVTGIQMFDAWLAAQEQTGVLREASSIAVYRSIWSALVTWTWGHGLRTETLNTAQLKAFLHDRGGAEELTARHAWRVLTLVDAVLSHGARQLHLPRNTAARDLLMGTPQWRYANSATKTPLPEHLLAHDARRLVGWLLDLAGAADLHGAPAQAWQTLRNRTAVALQLGAGLTPGDVRIAATTGVVFEGSRAPDLPSKIRLPSYGNSPAREAPLAPWAARLLRTWLDTRSALQLAGPVLFPATRSGRPWGKVAQYGAAKAVLAAAGVADVDGGSFRLRHTFALRQLRRGSAPEDVARWMGLRDVAALARYRRVLVAAAEVV